jgi:hypothetical protein
MLQGLDSSWNEVGSDGRTVTYTGLAARTYRFRVQGATVSSQWSEPGAELQIIILPPGGRLGGLQRCVSRLCFS